MRAMVVPAYGPPEVFECRQVPEPEPGPGEVLIRVAFVGVNFTGPWQRQSRWSLAAMSMRPAHSWRHTTTRPA